jgi:signal transduction histidine kinase
MSAQKRGIGIQNHVTDAAWLRVLADEMRLKQVLLNLLSNAVKYNREQGSVTIYAGLIDGNHLRISIADTGQGVAPGRHDDLFQPFSRVGMEDSAIEGTGIGLSICKQLMQLMHGDIGHADNPGGGSIFWITLPLDASTPRDDATTGGAARQPA